MAQKPKRRSEILLDELRDNHDEDTVYAKHLEWQQAVVVELETLDQKQDVLESRIDTLDNNENHSPRIILRSNQNEALSNDTNARIDALAQSIAKYKEETDEIKQRLSLLESENDTLIKRNTQLRSDLDKINEKIETTVSITQLRKEIKKINEHNARESSRLEEKINSRGSTGEPTTDRSRKIKIEMPKFKGLPSERPMKFITELENYFKLVKPESHELKCVISQALLGDAQNWWYLLQNDVQTYSEFYEKFKERFWNKNIQRNNARKVEFGHHTPGQRSRVNYATYMFGLARELKMKTDESELVKTIAEHFEREIRRAITNH